MRTLFFALFAAFSSFSLLEARTVLISKSINYLDEVDFQGVGKLIIRQGEVPGLQIEGEEEIIHDTKIRVQSGALKISRKESGFRQGSSSLICTVTVRNDLNRIVLKGDVQLVSDSLTFADLQVDIHDRATGFLSLNGGNLLCRIYDKAQLTLSGVVKNQEVLVEDRGSYLAAALESANCQVKVVGAGLAEVQTEGVLSALVVGQGSIFYVKEPQEVEKRVSGTGQIQKRL